MNTMSSPNWVSVVILTAHLLFTQYAIAGSTKCNLVMSQTSFSTTLNEFFKNDLSDFSKGLQTVTLPGAADAIEKSLSSKSIKFLPRILSSNNAPVFVIDTQGPATFNRIAHEVFRRWLISHSATST